MGGEGTEISWGRRPPLGSAGLTRLRRGRGPRASRSQSAAPLGVQPAKRTPVGGSRVPPSRPPQVSKRSPAPSQESPVALPTRVAQQGLPGHVLLSVSPLPEPPSLLPGSFTRPLVQERFKKTNQKQKQKKTTTHSLTTFSTTAAIFPVPLPQAGRPPGAHNAQALSRLRTLEPRPSAQAQIEGTRTHWPRRASAGERA